MHLWNPSGSPGLHPDESDYLGKLMHVLAGLGPQENNNDPIAINDQPYTHPHFGQFFFVNIRWCIRVFEHRNSWAFNLIKTVEFLYTIPRLLMGTLAVSDTLASCSKLLSDDMTER